MGGRLDGKIALVTGGLSGIGAAVVRRMAEEGAAVVSADLAADGSALGAGPVSPFQTDVSDPASVAVLVGAVLGRHGRIDCLVKSAGIATDVPFLDTSLETFDRMVAVNLRGTFVVGQAVARASTRLNESVRGGVWAALLRGQLGMAARMATRHGRRRLLRRGELRHQPRPGCRRRLPRRGASLRSPYWPQSRRASPGQTWLEAVQLDDGQDGTTLTVPS